MQKYIETRHSLPDSFPRVAIRDYLERSGYSLQNHSIKEGLGLEITTSVVIPVYNETGIVEVTLQAINEQIYSNFEVIVVDNGSTDETCRVVKDFRERANYPLYIISEPNPGVANTRKKGMDEVLIRLLRRGVNFRHSIAVTDADTIPPRDWIRKITEGFRQNAIGGLAGTHSASTKIEKRITETVGIRNYFNIIPSLIEYLVQNKIGTIKMSGPNSAFSSLAYALGGGIRQEYDQDGRPWLSEVNNLGERIKKVGYAIAPMGCRVVKNRRRELLEIIHGGEDSYFPRDYSPSGRFNVVREDETELLDIACERVPKEIWLRYRYKMISKVIKNFIFKPLISGEITVGDTQGLFSPEEIKLFLNNSCFPQQDSSKIFERFLTRLESEDE